MWLISKYFKGKIYCSHWVANIPRSHSVVRPIRVIMQAQRAWWAAEVQLYLEEKIPTTCRLDRVKGTSLEGQDYVLLTRPCLQIWHHDLLTLHFQTRHHHSIALQFSLDLKFSEIGSSACLKLLCCSSLALPKCCNVPAKEMASAWCKLQLWSTSEWFVIKGMVLNVTWLLLDKTAEAPSCTLEEIGKCF